MSAPLKQHSIALLSTTTLSVRVATATTLYTVPTQLGKRCLPDHIKIICGSDASTTAKITVGQVGALTDFLAENTLTNLAAQYDMVICRPIPATTPLKSKSYAPGTVIQIDVTTADADGSTDCTVLLFGTLY